MRTRLINDSYSHTTRSARNATAVCTTAVQLIRCPHRSIEENARRNTQKRKGRNNSVVRSMTRRREIRPIVNGKNGFASAWPRKSTRANSCLRSRRTRRSMCCNFRRYTTILHRLMHKPSCSASDTIPTELLEEACYKPSTHCTAGSYRTPWWSYETPNATRYGGNTTRNTLSLHEQNWSRSVILLRSARQVLESALTCIRSVPSSRTCWLTRCFERSTQVPSGRASTV